MFCLLTTTLEIGSENTWKVVVGHVTGNMAGGTAMGRKKHTLEQPRCQGELAWGHTARPGTGSWGG